LGCRYVRARRAPSRPDGAAPAGHERAVAVVCASVLAAMAAYLGRRWCRPTSLPAGCLPLSVSRLALAALASFRRVVALSLPVAYILLVRRASGHAGILISAGFELVKPGDEASPEGEVRSRMLCFTRSTRPDTRTSSTHTRARSTHTSHTHTYIARNSGRCRVRPLSNRSQVIGCSRKWRTNALPQSRRFLRAPSEAPGSSNTTVRPAERWWGLLADSLARVESSMAKRPRMKYRIVHLPAYDLVRVRGAVGGALLKPS
jgi:hypothetical protein